MTRLGGQGLGEFEPGGCAEHATECDDREDVGLDATVPSVGYAPAATDYRFAGI
jgi:hypothetical protein